MIIRRLLVITTVLLSIWVPAVAQDTPVLEVFGGYSAYSQNPFEPVEFTGLRRLTFQGWQASVAGNLTPWFGIVADFGRQSDNLNELVGQDLIARRYQILFGPELSVRRRMGKLFVHSLFGLAEGDVSFGSCGICSGAVDTRGFMMGFGGGLDVNAGGPIAARVIQFDWVPNRVADVWSKKDFRIGFGIVLKAGR